MLCFRAKTVSSECEEISLKEQVIHSAMKTAFATSELVACTRVVGPTIEHQPCKDHLIEAVSIAHRNHNFISNTLRHMLFQELWKAFSTMQTMLVHAQLLVLGHNIMRI